MFVRQQGCRGNDYADFPLSDGTFWDFTSDLAKGDTAYTTLALGAHTDTTYFVRTLDYYYPPHPLTGGRPDGSLRPPTVSSS